MFNSNPFPPLLSNYLIERDEKWKNKKLVICSLWHNIKTKNLNKFKIFRPLVK